MLEIQRKGQRKRRDARKRTVSGIPCFMLQKAKVADGYAVSGAGCSVRTFARPASHVNRKDHNLRKIGTTGDLVFTIGHPLRSQRGKLTSPSQRLERSTLLETLVLSSATTKTETLAKDKVPLTSERGRIWGCSLTGVTRCSQLIG